MRSILLLIRKLLAHFVSRTIYFEAMLANFELLDSVYDIYLHYQQFYLDVSIEKVLM